MYVLFQLLTSQSGTHKLTDEKTTSVFRSVIDRKESIIIWTLALCYVLAYYSNAIVTSMSLQQKMAAVTVGQVGLFGRLHIPRAIGGVYVVQHRQASNLPNVRRGRGGRSSYSGHVVTVFGANGFTGTKIINRLGKNGSKIIAPYRHDPYHMKNLRLAADLGQIQFLPYHLKDEDALRQCMKYSDTVINVINRDYPTRNFTLEDLHVTGAKTIARVAKEIGVSTLVHFSHLAASPNPRLLFSKEGTEFLQMKHAGELAVREEFPEAIVFRPSDMYGSGDRFLRQYAMCGPTNKSGPLYLWKKGEETIKQPVFCSDVVDGVMKALATPDSRGMTYEAVGSDRFYLADLVKFFYFCMRRPTPNLQDFTDSHLFRLKYLEFYLPHGHYKLRNSYRLEREAISDATTGLPTLEDLGVKLTRIQDYARYEYKTYRADRYYDMDLGQFAEWPDPPTEIESYLHPTKIGSEKAAAWAGKDYIKVPQH